jgi:hypothetical protein
VAIEESPQRIQAASQEETMKSATRNYDGNTSAALGNLLRSKGFDLADFEIAEDQDSDLVNLLGLVGGIVTVRRLSTGEERLYSTGPGSAWFAALLIDLEQGLFGKNLQPDLNGISLQ